MQALSFRPPGSGGKLVLLRQTLCTLKNMHIFKEEPRKRAKLKPKAKGSLNISGKLKSLSTRPALVTTCFPGQVQDGNPAMTACV